MKCPRCGAEVALGEKFCKTCGNLIVNNEVPNSQINNEMPKENPTISNNQYNNMNVNETVNTNWQNQESVNSSNNQTIDPNSKKIAIISIIIPIVAIIIWWFIGLSFLFAVILVGAGFGLSERAKAGEPKLAMIGKILNIIFLIFTIIMFILNVIGTFAS